MSEKRVAQYIRNWRKQHDLSQQELADELNISRQSLIALEQGKYMPSLNLAVSMCDFFNAAFEEVFDIGSRAQEMIKEAGEDINKKINIRKGVNDMTREIGSWDPFREGVTLRDAMDRLFEDSVVAAPARMAMKVPKIDVMQKGNDIIVKAELPGIDEDKIDIDVAEDSITISGSLPISPISLFSESSISVILNFFCFL